LGFSQLICTPLLKINHRVITHLVARAMLAKNPTGKLYTKFLDHICLLLASLQFKRKSDLLLSQDQKRGVFRLDQHQQKTFKSIKLNK